MDEEHRRVTLTPMDERQRKLKETVLVIRHEYRACFGPSFADKWGYWVDECMATSVHSFGYWVDYPKGDHVLEGHEGWVQCAEITHDGCYLFTVSLDTHIIKWDLRTDAMIGRFTIEAGVTALALVPRKVLLGHNKYAIQIRDSEDYSLLRTLDGHTSWITSLTINKRETVLVSGSTDTTCRVWSMESGECLRELKGHRNGVESVLFAGDVIISGTRYGSIMTWDHESGKQLREVTDGISGAIAEQSLNSDSSMLACVYRGGFTLFQWPSMKVVSTVQMNCYCCCFHPLNPALLAVDDADEHCIKLFRTDTSQWVRTFKPNKKDFLRIRFTPDGHRLISNSIDSKVRVMDVSDLTK